ncbi:DUF4389 domain-containing protein [Arthrobacter wenxiniae]|uniref:DUF4389 domain-containing protein n=1 Tax=Arthrobacter wenxiniae TaxID=2713570 RepID=A0A7Y7IF01_9MICC|nr:DUF4389 domain-containing protein [Arthrobacter wenxiniae]NVM94235.1 DUF4389 domain-containing protein [Arthrobacter wenxiniae]
MGDVAVANVGTPGPGGTGRGVAGGVVALVVGVVLALLGVGGVVGATAASVVMSQQGPDGYLSSPVREFSTTSHALTSPPARIESGGLPFDLGRIRLSAASTAPGGQVFIGIGPKTAVENYLSGVHTTEITGVATSPFRVHYRDVPGDSVPTAPAGQHFWTVSAAGPGTQQLTMDLSGGDWVLVIMNADAGAGVTVNLQGAVHSELLGSMTPALWIGGILLLLMGTALIVLGAIILGRGAPHPLSGERDAAALTPAGVGPYPARLTGRLDPQLSRGLWLVKWLLAVPHLIILFFLWCAAFITTVIAGFAILFTGRYPRPLFNFAVGVLRWTWRVTFYAYSALATDRYPPFTLASTDYPADFEVAYPRHLSHGLVLVKWWLLAIPHLLIVGAFTSAVWTTAGYPGRWPWEQDSAGGLSLLGILVLTAAVILLFTGRYQRHLFSFIMGINRWIYRVAVYVLLLRDEYPPFRLDQGSDEPAMTGAPGATSASPSSGAPDGPPTANPGLPPQ